MGIVGAGLWERACGSGLARELPAKNTARFKSKGGFQMPTASTPSGSAQSSMELEKQYDVLAQKIAAGFQNVPEHEGAAKIEKAIRAARE